MFPADVGVGEATSEGNARVVPARTELAAEMALDDSVISYGWRDRRLNVPRTSHFSRIDPRGGGDPANVR